MTCGVKPTVRKWRKMGFSAQLVCEIDLEMCQRLWGEVADGTEVAEKHQEWHGFVVGTDVVLPPSPISVPGERATGLISGSLSLHSEQVAALSHCG